ncbi:imelysin family protein [Neptunomonas antarctica]|uniref:Predicted lipoprotein n=1 Tax=Neptunomonas antarctica TaxID=619304 RepID=A0A1N7IUB3_9GAMM|nr:imelysin family protein [Neptunomonas antarctica]SIS40699.1 Predicted lipoprotein [Neptunomonas antarctica]
MQPTGSLTPVLLGISLLILGVGTMHASAHTAVHAAEAPSQAPTEAQWHTLNSAIIEQHVMPRYQLLADNSATLEKQVQQLCDAPSLETLSVARTGFNAAQASWQGVQHIQFGPVTLLMRNYSLQYWPDKKNIGAKQLSAALASKTLASKDPASTDQRFDEEFFRAASISVKGFPALERLLFTNKHLIDTADTAECSLAHAIARHISDTAASIHTEWTEETRLISAAGENNMTNDDSIPAYETPSEAATEFMKSLVEPVDALRDTKLLSPLGASAAQSRWKKSESWRSEQSINNIRQNVIALHELYSGTQPLSVKTLLVASGDSVSAQLIESEFKTISEQLAALPAITDLKITAAIRQQLLQTTEHLLVLQNTLEQAMQTLNIQLGFNSRDGD